MSCFNCDQLIGHKSSRSNRAVHRLLLALLTISIIAACVLFVTLYASSSFAQVNFLGKFDSNQPLGVYNQAAISTDGPGCAKYGRQLLERNGTAMDAAISVLLCMGVVIPESLGLGGGVFIVYYKKDENKAWVIDGRETAPASAKPDMFVDNPRDSLNGAKAMGIPGELAAYWRAHNEFGNLKWSELFEGAIDIAIKGFPMHDHLHEAFTKSYYLKNGQIKNLFTNPATGKLYQLGEIMKRPDLVQTFYKLAATDANEFYRGSMGKTLVKEIQDLGGVITEQDFADYRANFYESVNISLPNGLRLYSVDPPGSGPLLGFILNVFLRLGKLESNVGQSLEDSALYYHRFVETFKHAYAIRTKLEDRSFGRIEETLKKLQSPEYVQSIMTKINDERTYPLNHYGGSISITQDHGTSHVSVVDQFGNAAAASSTVNIYFGNGIISPSTGIIFNDEMDDFSSANLTNNYGVSPSDFNHIEPGKRPFSSMCPSIIVDESGHVRMAIGASGGTQITTGVALAIVRSLYLGENMKQSIDAPRIHHQLSPNLVKYESNFPANILAELRERGHDTSVITGRSSVIMGITRNSAGQWTANSDYRKGGSVDGF